MALASTGKVTPTTARLRAPLPEESDQRLTIVVVFTSVEATLVALREAGTLASGLGIRITLVVPQIVPHLLPPGGGSLDLPKFNKTRFHLVAGERPVEIIVHICFCRDRFQALNKVLCPGSIVILGGRKGRWWPTRYERLARKLQRAGFEVIFKNTE